jgi:hypothetical protein
LAYEPAADKQTYSTGWKSQADEAPGRIDPEGVRENRQKSEKPSGCGKNALVFL